MIKYFDSNLFAASYSKERAGASFKAELVKEADKLWKAGCSLVDLAGISTEGGSCGINSSF
jgi:hypothetical protein